MLASQKEVSDLLFTVDRPLQVESYGELKPVAIDPPIEKLTPFQMEMLALNIIGDNLQLVEHLLKHGSCDSAYALTDKARFRVNIFSQRGNFSAVLRQLTTRIPTLEQLKLPEIFKMLPKEKTGLILVTGATGSGKSTTLAAMVGYRNEKTRGHIVTIEDPVEYELPGVAQIPVRPSRNFTFANGLRAALRQAPKVILVGEMRDQETVKIALSAAETGHLVLSTLHTVNAGETVNRILGMFEAEDQEQIRIRLADSLRWIVSQRLAPKIGGGRCALLEIMGHNLRTEETVRLGESEGKTFYEIIEASYTFGWRTFDQACIEAFEKGVITEENALLYCSKRGVVSRGIDNIKKERGEITSTVGSLKMRSGGQSEGEPVPPGSGLKLK